MVGEYADAMFRRNIAYLSPKGVYFSLWIADFAGDF
jgi:hypothetical protein